jgi:PTS system nitrogen regulatory IIA component
MTTHFGATLRMLRMDAGLGLGELAARIGVSSAYLSRVEHGHDPVPTHDRVIAIAHALELPPIVLLEIAQGAGAALASYLERVPEASSLFLEMATRELGAVEIARVKAFMDRTMPERGANRRRPARLSELLVPNRVLVRAVCSDIDDLVSVASTRLAADRAEAKTLVAKLLEREGAASSAMGAGVVAPHAFIAGQPSRAVLVILARPIKARTPDGVPIQMGIVLVEPAADRTHLERLAHIARLAARGLANVLDRARTPDDALRHLATLDVS